MRNYSSDMRLLDRLYPYRFGLYLLCVVAILFGSLIIPTVIFDSVVLPLLFFTVVLAGIVFISKTKWLLRTFMILFVALVLISTLAYFGIGDFQFLELIRISVLFAFFLLVTYKMIYQVWMADQVNRNVIFGLIAGYISIGFVGSLLMITIEMLNPGSFMGLNESPVRLSGSDDLLYYSFITLMTIGYGDILPVTELARKAAILIGLLGQFYLVIFTAVVVAKFIRQQNSD